MGKSIMIQGTASDVGKSLIVTGLCRIYSDRGVKVFPFKSQNMALNSYKIANRDEIGRAQSVQAEAARRFPEIRMNPILLKPVMDSKTKVIFKGKHISTVEANDYYKDKKKLKAEIKNIFEEITIENDLIVIEGAGSPAEINLNKDDFVNMGMAEIADCPVLLVADIDRGGVFASIFGTIKLLSEKEQSRVKGIIINKFRGDISLLEDGLRMIEELVDIPVIGVVPYIDLAIDSEDSLALSEMMVEADVSKDIDVAVLMMDFMTNFNEFNSLLVFDDVSVRFVKKKKQLRNPDVLIIPDSEDILGNRTRLQEDGWMEIIDNLVDTGTLTLVFGKSYEILKPEQQLSAVKLIEDQVKVDDYKVNLQTDWHHLKEKNIIHVEFPDIFEYLNWTTNLLNFIQLKNSRAPIEPPNFTYKEFKDQQYDLLANHLRKHLDLNVLDEIISGKKG
ncbi:cobyric acid synthase [Fundicoccus culcitae]|uniref:Cobyric acid synthase n=1 Tax=Fundicoccus culcitae TaxID=2969821 RepID=A0ABY5P436_9LACT|nr:cobyric acid synthase [Fundicoccus culcitae]UUX33346.1 cobyric acid synthase [Fundicoccus culcitae]